MIGFSAYLLGNRGWPVIWVVLLVVSVFAQLAISKNSGASGHKADRLTILTRAGLSLFDTFMYSAAAACISQVDTSLAGGFSILIVMLTMLYVLMHFYMQPGLVLVLSTPCFLSLVYCLAGHEFQRSFLVHPWQASIPILGALFAAFFFTAARRHLARARRALVSTRSEALKRAAEAQAASQSKTEFLATMGHEIRTPLNGVLGIAQMMSHGELSDEQRSHLSIIRESGETLLLILNDLLDVSKIEAGKLELESTTFSMLTLMRGVHATFSAAASAKDIDFKLDVDAEAAGLYRGDEARLRQILYNLVSNAVKFTHVGEVCVKVGYADGRLQLSVRDTGIGIAPDRQHTLFEKFVQADASTTRRYGGTGLGLSIVHQLVTLMGGALEVQSVQGMGSTFTASIPIARIGDEAIGAPAASTEYDERPAVSDADVRILVAEDNPTNQLVIKMMLGHAGIEAHIVENGKEAVAAWQAHHWDIILMDVQMPEMDGLDATREIRRRERLAQRPRVPILALTANAMTHQAAEYAAIGMDGLVAKPINANLLFQALQSLLDGETEAADADADASVVGF